MGEAAANTFTIRPGDVAATTDGTADYKVAVKAVFDANTPDRVRTQTTAQLAETTVALQQIREASPAAPATAN